MPAAIHSSSRVVPDNSKFLTPREGQLVNNELLAIAVDDIQTCRCNGIHTDFLSETNPEVHGINGTIEPDDDPSLAWYKGKFIATGLRVPTLILTTLLHHLFEPSPLIQDTVGYLKIDRQGLRGGKPDERLVSALGLERFPNDTIVGDIYSDGVDIIYWWMRGCAYRTAEAAELIRRSTRPRL